MLNDGVVGGIMETARGVKREGAFGKAFLMGCKSLWGLVVVQNLTRAFRIHFIEFIYVKLKYFLLEAS